jgi:hypothetical protein
MLEPGTPEKNVDFRFFETILPIWHFVLDFFYQITYFNFICFVSFLFFFFGGINNIFVAVLNTR